MIFDIQRFSINDGPGIRTTVFFKGCQTVLRCPIIPTLNERADHLEGIAAVANRLQHMKKA